MSSNINNNFSISIKPKVIEETLKKNQKEENLSIFDSLGSELAEYLDYFE